MKESKESIIILKNLFKQIEPKRRKKFFVVLTLMVFASISEILLLSTLMPFISSLTNPDFGELNYPIIEYFSPFGKEYFALISLCIFALMVIISSILRLLNLKMSTAFAALLGSDIGIKSYRNTLSQSYETHINWNTSKLIATITSEVAITVTAINNILQVIVSSLIAIGLLSTMFSVNWKIAMLSISIFTLSYILIAKLSKKKLAFKSKQFAQLNANQYKSLQEGYGAIREVILDSKHDFYIKNFAEENRILMKIQGETQFLAGYPRYLLEGVSLIILILVSYSLYSNDPSSSEFIPAISVFALGSLRILPALQQIYLGWAVFKASQESIKNVLENLNLPRQDLRIYSENIKKNIFKKSLEIKNLNYKYPNANRNVLNNVNLIIKPGDCIGIIGASGVGKSTLIDIIMGLLTPQDGIIEIDGKNINKGKTIKEFQKNISHVPQSIFLADCSILENITLGIRNEEIDFGLVDKSIEIAQLKSLIKELPRGILTNVGEKGVKLSGGQRQRIGLARAFYKNTPFFILDEATSALDEKNEKLIIAALSNSNFLNTIIMISHRKSTLKNCDRVYSIKEGRLILVKDF